MLILWWMAQHFKQTACISNRSIIFLQYSVYTLKSICMPGGQQGGGRYLEIWMLLLFLRVKVHPRQKQLLTQILLTLHQLSTSICTHSMLTQRYQRPLSDINIECTQPSSQSLLQVTVAVMSIQTCSIVTSLLYLHVFLQENHSDDHF